MPRISKSKPSDIHLLTEDKSLALVWYEAILLADHDTLTKFGLNAQQMSSLRSIESRQHAASKLLSHENTQQRNVSKRVVAAQAGILPVSQTKALAVDKSQPLATFQRHATITTATSKD